MTGVTSADQIVREDLSNLYINLDKRDTPFQTALKRGDDLKNVKLFSWALEGYDGRMIEGIPEGKDVDDFETDKQYPLYGRSQKFWRRPHVTTEANTINAAPADFGKYNKQVVKKIQEQKRDIEQRLLSDADSRDDDGVNGREFMGLGRFVNDGVSVGSAGAALTFTDSQTAVPAAFRTPTAQIYTGNLTTGGVITLTADTINGMLQSRSDALGGVARFSAYVDPLLKRHFTRIEGYAPNMTGFTPVTQRIATTVGSREFIISGAELWRSDFGDIDINLDSWMPRRSDGTLSGRGYLLDMEFISLRFSGLYLTHMPIDDKGAGPRGLIQSILGPQWGDPRAHIKIDPNVATG
jgi:hypothetical protein